MTERTRDAYAEVGEATRLAIDRAMPGLTLPEARVMLALVRQLTSWSILGEPIAARQLAEMTGMDDRAVRRAVATLADRCAIVRQPSAGRHASTYRLPIPDGANPGDTDQGSEDPGSPQPGSDSTLNPGRGDPLNPGSPDHLPENYARTTPEDSSRRTSTGNVRPLDGIAATPPAPADPAALARSILNDWWEQQQPRPQQPYPGALKVLTKALRDGWTADELRRALPELPNISGGALDYWRRRRNGGGHQAPSSAAAEALAKRVMGLR